MRPDRPGAARPPGAGAMDARAGARLGAVWPGHGDEAKASLEPTARSSTGTIRCGATPIRCGPVAPARCSPRSIWPILPAGAKADAAAGRRRRPQRHPALQISQRAWCSISCRRCRCGSPRCARSAPIRTCSRSRASWTSLPTRPAPIRSISASAISMIGAPAKSSRRPQSASAGRRPQAARAWPRLCLRPVQESRRLLRGRLRGRGQPPDRPRATGARNRRRRYRTVVNPDGLINQIEGAIVQSTSWTFYESVNFDHTRITSIDWETYPILRFNAVPEQVDVQ